MKISVRRRDHGVAQQQQRASLAALLAAALLGFARPAAAAEPAPSGAARAEAKTGYGVPLTFAYVLAPLAAFGLGGAISEAGFSDETAVGVAAPLFLAPAGVHLHEGTADRALISLGSMVGLTFGGLLLGAGAGYLENEINCDPERDSECQDRGIGTTIAGGVVGVIVGYTSSAILDVALNSSALEPPAESAPAEPAPAQRTRRAASLWFTPVNSGTSRDPLAAPRASGSNKAPDGLVVGVALSL
ncbi:MAG TPA: hypothetical protein VFS67_16370 [Polyangiaceae bacterium]|nr:hypothetical protein [Polyangiaceae bacterium]